MTIFGIRTKRALPKESPNLFDYLMLRLGNQSDRLDCVNLAVNVVSANPNVAVVSYAGKVDLSITQAGQCPESTGNSVSHSYGSDDIGIIESACKAPRCIRGLEADLCKTVVLVVYVSCILDNCLAVQEQVISTEIYNGIVVTKNNLLCELCISKRNNVRVVDVLEINYQSLNYGVSTVGYSTHSMGN